MIPTSLRPQPGRPLRLRLARDGSAQRATAVSAALARMPVAVLLADAAGVLVAAEGLLVGEAAKSLGPLVGRSAFELAGGARFVADSGTRCSGEVALRRALAGDELGGIAHVAD